jgi:hypothetical protein
MAARGSNGDDEHIKCLDASLNESCVNSKNKKKQLRLEEYSKRKERDESLNSKTDHLKYQVP